MKVSLLVLASLLGQPSSALATGDPFGAYICCKKVREGKGASACPPEIDKGKCDAVISAVDSIAKQQKELKRAWPGENHGAKIDDVSVEVIRSTGGGPLKLKLKYSFAVPVRSRGRIIPTLQLLDRSCGP